MFGTRWIEVLGIGKKTFAQAHIVIDSSAIFHCDKSLFAISLSRTDITLPLDLPRNANPHAAFARCCEVKLLEFLAVNSFSTASSNSSTRAELVIDALATP